MAELRTRGGVWPTAPPHCRALLRVACAPLLLTSGFAALRFALSDTFDSTVPRPAMFSESWAADRAGVALDDDTVISAKAVVALSQNTPSLSCSPAATWRLRVPASGAVGLQLQSGCQLARGVLRLRIQRR